MHAALCAALMALCCQAGLAQSDPSKGNPATADDPDGKSVGTASESRIVLEVGDADAKATARLAHAFNLNPTYRGRYGLTVTAPFDRKKADSVDVGTLSGLTPGTSATLEFGVARWRRAGTADVNAVDQVCDKYIPLLIPGHSWDDVTTATSQPCHVDLFQPDALAALIKKINERRASCAKCVGFPDQKPSMCEVLRESSKKGCTGSNASTAAACALLEKSLREDCAACENSSPGDVKACDDLAKIKHDAKLVEPSERLLAQANQALKPQADKLFQPLTMLTVALKGNTQHFDYVLEDDLITAQAADKKGAGITVALTHVLRSSAWIFGYSHENSYKGSDPVQLCMPVAETGATSCKQAAIGAPKKQPAEIAFIENRAAFGAGRFALAPRVEFDFEKSNWAVRLPFYFIANKDKELIAGFALGYSEAAKEKKQEEFGASVFISKAFTFY